VGDGQNYNISGNYPVIDPEVSASQAIKGRMKTRKFLDSGFAKGQRGYF